MEALESPPIAGQQTIYDQLAPTHGSLFSGYGGIDIAVSEVFGARTAWVSDIDPGPCKVLGHRFPGVPNLGDITKIDWADVEPVDILSGGSPCQDLSAAGRRAGMTEGTRSNLWVQMREAIETLQPRLVVWENVMGALSARATSELESVEGRVGDGAGGPALRALGRVLGDLAEIGFDAEWATVRASDVGAPHGRARVFLLAWPSGSSPHSLCGGSGGWASQPEQAGGDDASLGPDQGGDGGGGDPHLTLLPTPRVSSGNGVSERELREGNPKVRLETSVALLPTPTTSYSARSADQWIEQRRAGNGQRRSVVGDLGIVTEQLLPAPSATRGGSAAETVELLPTPKAGDADFGLPRTSGRPPERSTHLATRLHYTDFGSYGPAIERWERATGRPAPDPTKPSPKTGKPQLSAEFVEWMMGLPHGWFTSPEIGLTRVQALKIGGNGVVPQQAEFAIRGLMDRIEVAA